MKKKTIRKFVIKLLKAILYVLSAGHLCSCKNTDGATEGDEKTTD